MDIPICKGDLCYCVDVLDALTKDFFARKGNPVEETAELGNSFARKLYKCSILLIAFKQNALYTYLRSVKTKNSRQLANTKWTKLLREGAVFSPLSWGKKPIYSMIHSFSFNHNKKLPLHDFYTL